MSARDGFEAELNAAWEARDFAAWLDARRFYADWLEERGDALAGMARTACRRLGVELSPHYWRLLFRLPPSRYDGPTPSKWRRGPVNAGQLLGLPPTTARLVGLKDWAVFVVVFGPRDERHRPLWRDTDLHPLGFARLFLRKRVRTLFDGLGREESS